MYSVTGMHLTGEPGNSPIWHVLDTYHEPNIDCKRTCVWWWWNGTLRARWWCWKFSDGVNGHERRSQSLQEQKLGYKWDGETGGIPRVIRPQCALLGPFSTWMDNHWFQAYISMGCVHCEILRTVREVWEIHKTQCSALSDNTIGIPWELIINIPERRSSSHVYRPNIIH
jgi:hypothetical protein